MIFADVDTLSSLNMSKSVIVILILGCLFQTSFSFLQQNCKVKLFPYQNKVTSKSTTSTALFTTLPLPLLRIPSIPLFAQAKRLSMSWKTLVVMLAAIITRFKSKLKKEVRKVSNQMESGWTSRGQRGSTRRTLEIWTFSIYFIYRYLRVNRLKKGDPIVFSQAKTEIAKLLTNKLLQLGPTFIKLGQLLSTRIDVLPKEYINELVLLQDQVPGFSGDIAVSIIEEELGKPIDQLFDYFNRTSLAAASLGQVHVATLNGQRLAVKVQRQGLKKLFDMDLKNIKVLAQLLDKFDPKTDGASRDWVSIYEESAKLLYKEINYEAEALNSIRFRDNFAGVPWIKVPDVLLNMTTSRVVTMEYVPGIKINDIERIEAAGIDRQLLAKRSAESYLSQLCRYGFFHCDPHPGNVACDAEYGGRLIYYDFGMMDELTTNVRRGLVNLIFGIYEVDVKETCNALEEMGILRKGVDRISVEKIARYFLSEFALGVSGEKEWSSQLSKEEQKALKNKRRAQLGSDLFSVGSDVPFVFPPTFTFVFRAFTSLDGIGKGLDPKYDLTKLAQPFLKELIDLRDGSATISFLKTWGKKLGWRPIDIANAIQSPRKIAYVDDTMKRMEQGDLKVRVRVIESERAFAKMEIVQSNLAFGMAASGFLNIGVLLATVGSPTGQLSSAAKVFLGLAGVCGLKVPIGLIQLKSLEKKIAPPA